VGGGGGLLVVQFISDAGEETIKGNKIPGSCVITNSFVLFVCYNNNSVKMYTNWMQIMVNLFLCLSN
jgi:hypothetical protein